LVKTLKQQHNSGKQLIGDILEISSKIENHMKYSENIKLANYMKLFVVMYRPHKAREDTVLFPALHKSFSSKEYAHLGQRFEDKEHELFGNHGFEKNLADVVNLEKQIGIDIDVKIPPKKTTTYEFVPDKPWTFKIFCTVYCGLEHACYAWHSFGSKIKKLLK